MKNKNLSLFLLFLQFTAALLILPSASGAQPASNSLKLSFAFVGDFQIGYSNWQATKDTNPSSMNIPQVTRTVKDLRDLSRSASFVFFLGDLVMAEGDDHGEGLRTQLDAWQALYSNMPKSRLTRLAPIAGNHELNIYRASVKGQGPSTYAYDVWLDWIARNHYQNFSGNGPKPRGSNPDHLVRDESRLTFSFDRKGIHFIVINTDTLSSETDPATNMPYAGWIPINWIEKDLTAARKNPDIKAIIVAGHRPIEGASYDQPEWGTTIINNSAYPFANRLSTALRKNRKVKAYLTSHTHSWHSFRLTNGKGPYQIIAGNGGAELDTQWTPKGGQYFGYSVLDIYTNGKMLLRNYGRSLPPAPQKFFEDQPVAPSAATLKGRVTISRRW